MNHNLPFLPGYSFRDPTKTRFVFPSTLVYSKGVPISKTTLPTSSKMAMSLLEAENKFSDRDTLARLTYGRKKPAPTKMKLPWYLEMDKKVLRFNGYFKEENFDWDKEDYRIRPVTVLYYLQDDTMEVIEPKIENSGLVQGTLFKRHPFPHPTGRHYLWKDLNLGVDLIVHGLCIRLADCDEWTREYLTDAGLELNSPEEIPPDPYEQQKQNRQARREVPHIDAEDEKLFKFLTNDGKVLRFYGLWKDTLNDPPDIRHVVVLYYLADDTMELLEDRGANKIKMPLKSVLKKQKIPLNRNELSENFPSSYLEIKENDLRFFKPMDLRTGKDIVILGKKIFLYDCDAFTRQFYKSEYGVENMEKIKVVEKPKPLTQQVLPPHDGIGGWDDSLQNCHSIVPKPPKKNFLKELHFDGIILRYKAHLVTTIKDDYNRKFIITFHPADDTVAINEEYIPNSGFPGGAFLRKGKLPKPGTNLATEPTYYSASDFFIGAEIRAAGKTFKLVDADQFVLKFMEQHPEIYTDDKIEIHRKAAVPQNENQPLTCATMTAKCLEKTGDISDLGTCNC